MKCKVCGKRFKLLKEKRYEITDVTSILSPLIGTNTVNEAFDCPKCGCQNVVNVRKKGVKTMIKLENVDVYGFEAAVRGMRNPLNSWDKSDSTFEDVFEDPVNLHDYYMKSFTAPLYWWKEFDTYKVGTVRNSCSTMHKIHSKEFTLDDFSCEHLQDIPNDGAFRCCLKQIIAQLNYARDLFIETNDKTYWWQMIQLLPSSYNQRATVQLNYAVLQNMYHSRKNHKLDEWHVFCKWVESLPYSELITSEGDGNELG